jgi:CO/xanthine dehydrogenase FAD-binding subunit
MPDNHVQIFYPATLNELFSFRRRFPKAMFFSCGASFLGSERMSAFHLPPDIISTEQIAELKSIRRTERYLELGAFVTLGEVLRVGKIVPLIFRQALELTANANSRNIMTLGGCVCNNERLTYPAAALLALDASYELRGNYETRGSALSRWVSAARYLPEYRNTPATDYGSGGGSSGGGNDTGNADAADTTVSGEEDCPPLLARIRIPLEDWSFCQCRVFRPAGSILALFLARIEKKSLSDIRLVFATGIHAVRDKDSEMELSGKSLPLEKKAAVDFLDKWQTLLEGLDYLETFSRIIMLNHIESLLAHFSE